jgi:hypothetical protein
VDLRDYFAGQALAGMLSHPETELDKQDLVPYMYECYQIADAMLVARGAKPAGQGESVPTDNQQTKCGAKPKS